MGSDYYIVNEHLAAYSLTSLVAHDLAVATNGAVQPNDAPPIPVTPDETLQPGVIYPSSNDPRLKFYLPTYQLNVVNGRYTTSLKWRSATDDPNGPLAFLTVELLGVAPQAPGVELRPIEHTAVLRIGYQLPIQLASAAATLATAPFAGVWTNVDANTSGMTRLEITPFCFPVATNAYVFDIPGDVTPTTNHILIPYQVTDGGGQVVGAFYQDSAYPDQCYYQPRALALSRWWWNRVSFPFACRGMALVAASKP